MTLLIINICKEKLHYYEFVKPIEDVLRKNKIKFFTKHYKEIKEKDLQRADKIIICGTSLKDNDFLKNMNKFEWIKNYKKPVWGICAGMQIISLVFGGKKKKATEIGYYSENFKKSFLSLESEHEVYHLHNNYMTLPKDFEQFSDGKIPQAVKHKTKPMYGVLFHPEVRNKKMIEAFCKL
ncbi:MAG TPA: gamma-glutamyl-gamma-aminobutyrate hydrolase family protein [Candidatus Nanoarchaeia archaeon]|nr:gamma-glutamyl-gamma-aminobutyrate hydrolase family protein [Candidatus Nanoarchaeia archaeon]